MKYLAISSDSKQRLFPSDHLHRPQCSQSLTTHGQLHLGTVDASQLTSVIVSPDTDLTTATARQHPVIWGPETFTHRYSHNTQSSGDLKHSHTATLTTPSHPHTATLTTPSHLPT